MSGRGNQVRAIDTNGKGPGGRAEGMRRSGRIARSLRRGWVPVPRRGRLGRTGRGPDGHCGALIHTRQSVPVLPREGNLCQPSGIEPPFCHRSRPPLEPARTRLVPGPAGPPCCSIPVSCQLGYWRPGGLAPHSHDCPPLRTRWRRRQHQFCSHRSGWDIEFSCLVHWAELDDFLPAAGQYPATRADLAGTRGTRAHLVYLSRGCEGCANRSRDSWSEAAD